MNTPAAPDSATAFPVATSQPERAALREMLGSAGPVFESVLARLREDQPDLTLEWKYAARPGWHQIACLKKRRLFYLLPKRGDFRLSLILGAKAIALLKQGPCAKRTVELLQNASRYPEGTAFLFDRATAKPGLLAAFIAAKIAH